MIQFVKNTVLILLGIVVLSGCFEIKEDIHYHKNGSGSYTMLFDMSEMKMMFDMLQGSEELAGENPMEGMDESSEEFVRALQGVEGIEQIKALSDTVNLKFGYSFDFKSIDALNAALNAVNNQEDNGQPKPDKITYFTGNKRSLTRTNDGGIVEAISKEMNLGMDESEENAMAADMLKSVKYTTTYHFDKKIKKASNAAAVKSSDGKSISVEYYLFDQEQMEGAQTGNAIKF